MRPATLATQCNRVSSRCSTCSTPSMNSGNSSNCVHWLYAVDTGTSTWIASAITRPRHLFDIDAGKLCVNRRRICGSATAAAAPAPTRTSSLPRTRWLRFFSRRAHAARKLSIISLRSRRSASSVTNRPAAARIPTRDAARSRAAAACTSAATVCVRNALSPASAAARSAVLATPSLNSAALLRRNITPIPFPRISVCQWPYRRTPRLKRPPRCCSAAAAGADIRAPRRRFSGRAASSRRSRIGSWGVASADGMSEAEGRQR